MGPAGGRSSAWWFAAWAVVAAARAPAAPAFVQVATNGGSAPLTVGFSAPVPAGHAVVVGVYYGGTSVSLSDSAGNTYALAAQVIGAAGLAGARCELFYAAGVDAGAPLTIRAVGPTTPFQLFALEYSGVDEVAPLDSASAATSGTSGSTAADSGAVATTLPNELLVAFAISSGSIVGGAPGFTTRSTFNSNLLADEVVAPGNWTATATSSSADWFMILAAFRAAGGADAGGADAGGADAGAADAGAADAGAPDAGAADAGASDAGSSDAGASDAGSADAGSGAPDAGTADAGPAAGTDGGTADGGEPDRGGGTDRLRVGCDCSSGSPGLTLALAVLLFGWSRSRALRRRVAR